mmetsp:Transcript_15889/g.23030  ORF Transcript_15889/g.23030 Transcript_15889/m.23030 type:complete len:298 (-) Transcript_15889:14-907(-)
MSLTYADQHQAWQQRVQKEITAHSKFYSNFDSSIKDSYHLSFSRKTNQPRRRHYRTKSTPKTDYQKSFNVELNTSNIYAEVRGKYARPAPPLNQYVKADENPTLARPATAGSYRSKRQAVTPRKDSSRHRTNFRIRSKKSLNSNVGSRANSVCSNQTEGHKRYKSFSMDKKLEKPPKPETPQQDYLKVHDESPPKELQEEAQEPQEPQEPQENLEENLNEKAKQEDNESVATANSEGDDQASLKSKNSHKSDKESVRSFETTSSQRRYIQELEELLKKERLKRLSAEKALEGLKKTK